MLGSRVVKVLVDDDDDVVAPASLVIVGNINYPTEATLH